jgi:hypothetical protein
MNSDNRILSDSEKRQVVYASLLRYSTEATSLRDRVLDKLVVGALIGSSDTSPFLYGKIKENLPQVHGDCVIRDDAVHAALRRLQDFKKIDIREQKLGLLGLKRRHGYFLTDQGREFVSTTVTSSSQVFDAALEEILVHFTGCSRELAAKLCRAVLLKCFARFGRVLAKNVTNATGEDAAIEKKDLKQIFGEVAAETSISGEVRESLLARLIEFLASKTSAAQNLKFLLAQGFYLTELLGFEGGTFDPLTVQSFEGAIFYLDANVMLLGLLDIAESDRSRGHFGEMVKLAKGLNITLIVTRATLNEIRTVARERVALIEKFVDVVPEEIATHTDDQFVLTYFRLRKDNPELTPNAFLNHFHALADRAESEWNIQLDDKIEDEILQGNLEPRIASVINEEAIATRGWGKSDAVLQHDVAHYVLIREARKTHAKTWFLTRDRTLAKAGVRLSDNGVSICFSLLGFLHSISPFIQTSGNSSLSGLFSEALGAQMLNGGTLFQPKELALLAEFHEDVMSTPPEQLQLALDLVRRETLRGQPYEPKDVPNVSLALKSYISSSKDQKLLHVTNEAEKLRTSANAAQESRDRALAEAREKDVTIGALRTELQEQRKQTDILVARLKEQANGSVSRAEVLRILAACGGLLFAAVLLMIPIKTGTSALSMTFVGRIVCDVIAVLSSLWSAAVISDFMRGTPKWKLAPVFVVALGLIGFFTIVRGTRLSDVNEVIQCVVYLIAGAGILAVRPSMETRPAMKYVAEAKSTQWPKNPE